MQPHILDALYEEVRNGKGLSGTPQSVLERLVIPYLEQHTNTLHVLADATFFSTITKNKHVKECIKKMRASLRKTLGVFDVDMEKNNTSVKRVLQHPFDAQAVLELLNTHPSYKERGAIQALSALLEQHSGKRMLFLGCGFDPLLLSLWNNRPQRCDAVDVNGSLIAFIDVYLQKMNILGHASVCDLTKDTPKGTYDTVCALKLCDFLSHKRTEELMNTVSASQWIVSFAQHTLTGKKMRHPRRGWFRKMCERRGWSFKEYTFPKEEILVVNIC